MALRCGLLACGNAASLSPRHAPEAQEPAHWSSHRSDDVTADTASEVSVIATRIDREELLRPSGCLLGVMQRRQIPLFDERGIVRAQAGSKRHRQQRVAISRVAAQPGLRQVFRTAKLLVETCAF